VALPLVFQPGNTGFGRTLGEMLNVLNGVRAGILIRWTMSGAVIAGLAATLALGWLTCLTDRARLTSALTLLIWLAVPTLSIWFVAQSAAVHRSPFDLDHARIICRSLGLSGLVADGLGTPDHSSRPTDHRRNRLASDRRKRAQPQRASHHALQVRLISAALHTR
jgi:hypothetical protein